jgi:hypothetical protein
MLRLTRYYYYGNSPLQETTIEGDYEVTVFLMRSWFVRSSKVSTARDDSGPRRRARWREIVDGFALWRSKESTQRYASHRRDPGPETFSGFRRFFLGDT